MNFFTYTEENSRERPAEADFPIDFVVPFVDDSDPIWREKRQKYLNPDVISLNKNFRSWDNLHYWFRCIAKFAPWVHKIFLVTDNQVPEWLDTDNEKIVTVFHEDYIPEQYLPVFSANPIELNLHRIQGLSDHFVYFNDDTFLVSDTLPSFFFRDGLPCDYPMEMPFGANDPTFSHMLANDIMTINKKYNRREVLRKHWKKFYSAASKDLMKNNLFFSLFRSDQFFGFPHNHLASPMLKSAFDGIWSDFPEDLERTCRNHFRSDTDVNQYIVQYWMYVHGLFYPCELRHQGKSFQLNDSDSPKNNVFKACAAILGKQLKMVCLNDALIGDFESTKTVVNTALRTIVPDMCEFEKGYFQKNSSEEQQNER